MKKSKNIFALAAMFFGAILITSCTKAANSENVMAVNDEGKDIEAVEATNSNQPLKIEVSTRYEPKSIAVEKGQPVKLAFYRKDDKNCGEELVFPKLGIKKNLPVGETVLVEFTPQEAGEIAFSCGMNMMRGKIIVQ